MAWEVGWALQEPRRWQAPDGSAGPKFETNPVCNVRIELCVCETVYILDVYSVQIYNTTILQMRVQCSILEATILYVLCYASAHTEGKIENGTPLP